MKKLFLVLGFLVCSMLFCNAQTPQSGQLYLFVGNNSTELFCGQDKVEYSNDEKKISLKTSKGNLDLTIVGKDENGGYRGQDVAGNVYTVQAMVNNQTGGVGIIFVPDDDYRFTFFIGTTPVCDARGN